MDPAVAFSNFTDSENRGKELFVQHCSSCHGDRMVSAPVSIANNGLDLTYTDLGIGARTGFNQDKGLFKVPHLRNVAVTGPYMHDGRFETLEEVIDFYSDEVQAHDNLHPALRDDNGQVRRLNLSAADKQAMVDFLGTLTDYELAADVRFSDPFKR